MSCLAFYYSFRNILKVLYFQTLQSHKGHERREIGREKCFSPFERSTAVDISTAGDFTAS